MDPGTIVAIGFILFFVLFAAMMFSTAFVAARNVSFSMSIQTKPVEEGDFLKLISREEHPIVYYMKTTFGGHYYFATVKQDRICTKSRTPIGFPERCELVPIRRVM